MNIGDILQLVRDRLGFNQNINRDILIRHMELVRKQLEHGADEMPLPWFNFNATTEFTTVAGQRHVDLPESFIDFDDDFPLTVQVEGLVKELERVDYYEAAATVGEGMPEAFVLAGTQLLLYPLPDTAYTITVPHYSTGETFIDMPDVRENDWTNNFPMLILEETMLSLAKAVRDEAIIKLSEAPRYRADYIKKVEGRKHQLKSYRMGGRA